MDGLLIDPELVAEAAEEVLECQNQAYQWTIPSSTGLGTRPSKAMKPISRCTTVSHNRRDCCRRVEKVSWKAEPLPGYTKFFIVQVAKLKSDSHVTVFTDSRGRRNGHQRCIVGHQFGTGPFSKPHPQCSWIVPLNWVWTLACITEYSATEWLQPNAHFSWFRKRRKETLGCSRSQIASFKFPQSWISH
jgi:hypothetical protein